MRKVVGELTGGEDPIDYRLEEPVGEGWIEKEWSVALQVTREQLKNSSLRTIVEQTIVATVDYSSKWNY